MNSTFRLVVIAAITLAILFVASTLLVYPEEDTITELKKGIAFAEANEGASHKIELAFKKDFVARADLLDTVDRNVRFECNSDDCTGSIASISPRSLRFKQQKLMDVYFRCKRKELIQDCVIYFGEQPAQVRLKLLGFPDTIKTGETTIIGFQVDNAGLLDALGLNYEVLIFRKNSETELLLAEEFHGVIDKLARAQSKTIFEQFTINTAGNYVLRVSVEGEDAGFAFIEKEFIITGSISPNCKAVKEEGTFLNGEVCRTEYSCEGCQNGSECVARWAEKGLNLEIGGKEKAYIEIESLDGTCDYEAPPNNENLPREETTNNDNTSAGELTENQTESSECVAYDFLHEKGKHIGYFKMDPITGVPGEVEIVQTLSGIQQSPLLCPIISCEGTQDYTCFGRIKQSIWTPQDAFPSLWQELRCYGCKTAEGCFAAAGVVRRVNEGFVIGTETCYYYIAG